MVPIVVVHFVQSSQPAEGHSRFPYGLPKRLGPTAACSIDLIPIEVVESAIRAVEKEQLACAKNTEPHGIILH